MKIRLYGLWTCASSSWMWHQFIAPISAARQCHQQQQQQQQQLQPLSQYWHRSIAGTQRRRRRRLFERRHHLLCGSGSNVKRRQALSMETNNFRHPTNSIPLNRSPKICHRWLRRRPLSQYQIWCKSVHRGFWANMYLFIYTFFSGTHLQVRTVGRFSRLMAQTTRTHARVCLFGFCWYCWPFKRLSSPKPWFFGSVNRRFQVKRAKNSNFYIFETTA